MNVNNLSKIDSLLLSGYPNLEASDYCLFVGEYTIGADSAYSELNQLILNFKKEISRKNRPEWHYKEKAIIDVADLLFNLANWRKLKTCTWVPIPPHKIEGDPEYDDRLWDVLKELKKREDSLDIRKMLLAKDNRKSAHTRKTEKRPTTQEHLKNWHIDVSFLDPKPRAIIIFDDIITQGAGFKAAQKLLNDYFTNIPIAGIFIGRSVGRVNQNT